MKQYLELLSRIVNEGVEKESGRENMPNTIAIHGAMIKHDLKDGFPLLTTKKMFYKGIIHELLWFLRGETNIKYLVDNGVNIWNQDAYRWYMKQVGSKRDDLEMSMETFIRLIKEDDRELVGNNKYKLGDLGKVYGHQWRNQNGVDQIKEVLDGLKNNPFSRYHIVDGWNKADFPEMALPPCHLLYQFCSRPNKSQEGFTLDLVMFQRSCDTFLGVPFNIASMALFLQIMAKASGMTPGEITWIGGDTHLYTTHMKQVEEQINRKPMKLPTMKINKDISTMEDIENLQYEDFELEGYESHPAIKAVLSTGL